MCVCVWTACVVAVDSLYTVSTLWRVTCSVGGFRVRTESAPQALVCTVGARSEMTERAHSTFFCAPSGATSVGANFS